MTVSTKKKSFDFMGKAPLAGILSLLLVAASVYIGWSRGSAVFGVDFLGGHELVVRIPSDTPVGAEKIRQALDKSTVALGEVVVQAFESGSPEYSIRIGAQKEELGGVESSVVVKAVEETLKANFSNVEMVRTDFIGPTIGSELQRDAIIAVVAGLLAILIYIAYRFEFAFALGAVVAVFHDVIVCFGIYLWSGRTLSMGSLAAALTILGYSVNDTIVVFDRVREEIMKRGHGDLFGTVNYSITQTLSRTLITSILTLFSALALLLYGGGAISDLSFFLVVGVIAGTYSTIFIASPVALWWAGRGSDSVSHTGEEMEAA